MAMRALAQIEHWPAPHAAAALVGPEGVRATHGDPARVFRWASVTKLLTAGAVLVAAEEGILELDEPAGPPGSSVRHLLAHASGLTFEGSDVPIARPGERRIYSNVGYEALATLLTQRAEMPFEAYLRAAVLDPLDMGATVARRDSHGMAAAGVWGSLTDLCAFARELFAPRMIAPETLAEATAVAFPGLVGVIPGLGRYDPCDWGLGFELRDGKTPHWTGRRNSPSTFGHFGG